MKKRAVEAVLILAALILVFALTNKIFDSAGNVTACIDGKYYNITEEELDLVLITEDGLDQLSRFKRLERLTVIPYKESVARQHFGTAEEKAALKAEAERTFPDCTSLEDISFLKYAPELLAVDISFCGVSDLSPLAEMDNLTTVYMTDIPAEDYSPLLEMKSLGYLKISAGCGGDTVEELKKRGVTVCVEDEEIYQIRDEMISDMGNE